MTHPGTIYDHGLVEHLDEQYRRFEENELLRTLRERRKAVQKAIELLRKDNQAAET